MKTPKPYITLLYVGLFAIAMGYLESAVVVYIRALYYPDGFAFPMRLISSQIMMTELWREAATMVMLLGVGWLAGKTALQRFAYFIYAFAIWDIFYYVFLWALISWPQSLLTWDVLFFIPTTWVGPVIGPVINSVTMILLALVIILGKDAPWRVSTKWAVWSLLIAGSVIIIVSYTLEYSQFILQRYSWHDLLVNGISKEMLISGTEYMPQKFPWLIFIIGEVMHLGAVGMIWRRRI
ncbi:MAG: hypothetical protein WCL06_11275 [Bacteroidota bacterium]